MTVFTHLLRIAVDEAEHDNLEADLGVRVRDLEWGGGWFMVSGSGFDFFKLRAPGFGFLISGVGCRVSGVGFRISGFEFRFSRLGCRVLGFVFRVRGLGSRVWGFGFRGLGG